MEKPKLQNFKEELEQEEREKTEAEVEETEVEDDVEAETEVVDDNEEDSEAEASEEKDTGDKPNFYNVIEELKKKSQNKKDKNLSYSDNSNNNSFILNNR